MKHFIEVCFVGLFAGGTLSNLYASRVIAKAKAEVAAIRASVATAAKKL